MQNMASAKSLDSGPDRGFGNRTTGDRGSTSYGKRAVRRRVIRTSNGVVQRGLRRFGLLR
jgi:hypothetical protein